MGQALPLPANAQALRNYTETYQYDKVGNFLTFAHAAANGNWTRSYTYDQPNLPPTNNRLTSTAVGAGTEIPYDYDAHGNMTAMPHLSSMAWDFKDQLQATQQRVSSGPVETTYYVYDAGGRRVRKVNETANGTKADERIYLGGFEIYREYAGSGTTTLERQTLHVMDDKRRIALVETTTVDSNASASALPSTTQRYQFDNHLGSACLELDEHAAIISYEEYYPYGSTSYQAGANAAEVSLKRYRFTGKERDEENGFYYHGARYYAPWLGRWTRCDPAGFVDGVNLFAYGAGNPTGMIDPTGTETVASTPKDEAAQSSLINTGDYSSNPSILPISAGPQSSTMVGGSSAKPQPPAGEKLSSSAKTPAPPSGFELWVQSLSQPRAGTIEPISADKQAAERSAYDEAERHANHPNNYDLMVADAMTVSHAINPGGGPNTTGALYGIVALAASGGDVREAARMTEVGNSVGQVSSVFSSIAAVAIGSPQIAAEEETLPSYATRSQQLLDTIHESIRDNQTVSISPAIGPQGEEVDLIAATTKLNESVLLPHERLVDHVRGMHAEIQTMTYASENGYELLSINPSRPFCGTCAFWTLAS